MADDKATQQEGATNRHVLFLLFTPCLPFLRGIIVVRLHANERSSAHLVDNAAHLHTHHSERKPLD